MTTDKPRRRLSALERARVDLTAAEKREETTADRVRRLQGPYHRAVEAATEAKAEVEAYRELVQRLGGQDEATS